MNTLVIDAGPLYDRIALYRDGVLDDLQLESAGTPSLVGRIYKGRVDKVEPALEAAFVDIGLKKAGYLGIRDILPPDKREEAFIRDHIRGGQEILVQVIKDAREEKGVQLTTRITLPGKYLVLTPEEPVVNLSHKIAGSKTRSLLGDWIKSILPEGVGAVVRTDAASGEAEAVQAELHSLLGLWNRISVYRERGTAPMLVYKEASPAIRMMRRTKGVEIHRICSNSRAQTAELLEHLKAKKQPVPEVVESIEKEVLDKDAEDALNAFVQLPGGGSLWIEPTRALTVIDVNSGGHIGKSDAQGTFFRVNISAAVEIARQLRVRNISGMILIDFIDMKSADNRKAVAAALTDAVQRDRMPVSVLGYTKLGIMELTRKAELPPIRDVVTVTCECCEGTGRVARSKPLATDERR